VYGTNNEWFANVFTTEYDEDFQVVGFYTIHNEICTIHIAPKEEEMFVEFKDINLENAIRKKINKPSGVLYEKDINKITQLYACNKGIVSLDGIENLVKLNDLSIYGNEVRDISVLAKLKKLEKLDLSFNNIGDISALKELNKLTYLYLQDNEITDYTPTEAYFNNLEYKDFRLEDGQVVISVLKGLNNLYVLNLGKNKIRDISILENFINLEVLDISSNKIEDITPLKNMYNLNTLYLSDNNIKDYSPIEDKFDYLETKDFDLKGNSSFDNDKINYLISVYGFSLKELEYLGCRYNSIGLELKKELDEYTLPTYYDIGQILIEEEPDLLKKLTVDQLSDILRNIDNLISSEYQGFKYEETVYNTQNYKKED